MNGPQKLRLLFSSVRDEPAPWAGDDFAGAVMQGIRRESHAQSISVLEQLGGLFPRLAMATMLIIGLCIGADYCLSNYVQRDLSASAAEISQQWLFAVK